MTDRALRPQFSDDPRGGVFIDNGIDPITRVVDETPAETPSPETAPQPEEA
jgi:hypothetical protein